MTPENIDIDQLAAEVSAACDALFDGPSVDPIRPVLLHELNTLLVPLGKMIIAVGQTVDAAKRSADVAADSTKAHRRELSAFIAHVDERLS